MNTPVSFELAKLLKEKGYNKRTPMVWLFSLGKTHLRELDLSLKLLDDEYNAPTIAEVVMWLYEKYGIWIECLHRGDMGDFTFKISKLKKGWKTEPHYIHDNGFNSPTETYEAAIEYILNKLI